jgi:sulfite exporter TauE/SafE
MVGVAVAAVGLVITLVGAFADQVGLGGEGPDEFGGKQVVAVVIGALLMVVGLALAAWRGSRERHGSEAMEPRGEVA